MMNQIHMKKCIQRSYGHNGYNATKGEDGSILFDYDKIIETYALGGTMTECAGHS